MEAAGAGHGTDWWAGGSSRSHRLCERGDGSGAAVTKPPTNKNPSNAALEALAVSQKNTDFFFFFN